MRVFCVGRLCCSVILAAFPSSAIILLRKRKRERVGGLTSIVLWLCVLCKKVSMGAKNRNRYNQVPHLSHPRGDWSQSSVCDYKDHTSFFMH